MGKKYSMEFFRSSSPLLYHHKGDGKYLRCTKEQRKQSFSLFESKGSLTRTEHTSKLKLVHTSPTALTDVSWENTHWLQWNFGSIFSHWSWQLMRTQISQGCISTASMKSIAAHSSVKKPFWVLCAHPHGAAHYLCPQRESPVHKYHTEKCWVISG